VRDGVEARTGAWKNDIDWYEDREDIMTEKNIEEYEEYFEERLQEQEE